MAFPTINVQVTNIELSPGLSSLIDQKLQSLEKLIPESETDLSCKVEVEKLPEHQTGRIYRVEVNLFVGGTLHRATATEEQVEKAIDEVRNELKRELHKAAGKRQSLVKRGGQVIKNMMRFGR